MKKATGLVFVLLVIAMALVFTSAASAIPPHVPGPNDNQLICHQTQHHQLKQGDANENQKGVIINVDPSSIAKNPHIKHGDACIEPINPDPRAVAACAETEPFPSAAACTGEPECSITDDPWVAGCCEVLEIDPGGDPQLECGGNQACEEACLTPG